MADEAIELPPAPKKPYVRPQLHELGGADAAGKVTFFVESLGVSGPS